MYNEKIIGGKYFTLKRTLGGEEDKLYVNVSDVIEMSKELSKEIDNIKYGSLSDLCDSSKWQEAIGIVVKFLIDELSTINNDFDILFNINLDITIFKREFKYKNTVECNNIFKTLELNVKDCSWQEFFVKVFVIEYNKTNKDKK